MWPKFKLTSTIHIEFGQERAPDYVFCVRPTIHCNVNTVACWCGQASVSILLASPFANSGQTPGPSGFPSHPCTIGCPRYSFLAKQVTWLWRWFGKQHLALMQFSPRFSRCVLMLFFSYYDFAIGSNEFPAHLSRLIPKFWNNTIQVRRGSGFACIAS